MSPNPLTAAITSRRPGRKGANQLDADLDTAKKRHRRAEQATRRALDAWADEKDPRRQMRRWNAYKRWEERQETAWREMQRIWAEKDKLWARSAW